MNIKRNVILSSLAWTLIVSVSAGVTVIEHYGGMLRQFRARAEMAFEKDLTFRRWNALRGGVYVAENEDNRPNPYLDVPDRDLVTTSGKRLTMINPAYMTRQAHELQKENDGIQGHITSLKPIRPANAPDEWERRALESFERGEREAVALVKDQGQERYRFMRPMITEKPCLKCHAKQGYAEGDIRGGISVTLPVGAELAAFWSHAGKVASVHTLIWACGLIFAFFASRRLRRSIAQEHQARVEAESASLAKGEFLANMSHEIRTPLNGVMGMLQLLKEKNSPEEQAEYLTMAYESGNRLLSLLNDVLDFSRVEAGQLRLERLPFSPRELLQSVAAVFEASCAKHGLTLTISADKDLPEELIGDEARLRQVLFNLLGNAVKFTPQGGVTVEAWARPHGANPELVRLYLSIADTGIGIPEDKIDHVFERFTQVDASYTRRYQGAGLGLAIVKRLMDLMGGSIDVDSEAGRGTTFTLQVPLGLQKEKPKQAEPAGCASAEPGQKGQRLLLVEDEEVSRLSAQVMLRRLGYEVVTAADGVAAVEAWRAGRYHCVLMDIQMPLMNGVEATRAIRELEREMARPRSRIVALTAYAMPGDRERFLAAGMDDYVTKPVQPEALLLALRKAGCPRPSETQA